jgi:hypothetical protein
MIFDRDGNGLFPQDYVQCGDKLYQFVGSTEGLIDLVALFTKKVGPHLPTINITHHAPSQCMKRYPEDFCLL